MITYKLKRLVTVAEVWYSGDAPAGADIVHYWYFPDPSTGADEFTTIWIDLSKPQDELLSDMNKSTRHHIRKAAEYELRYDYWHPDTAAQLSEFIDFSNASNAAKDLGPVDARWLRRAAECGALDLSRVMDRDGSPLVWHAHYREASHARQTHTASVFRSRPDSDYRTFLGRTNRWGWWEDMKRFQREGIQLYDFGGWYSGTENKELLAVNFFKEGFGGRIVKTYNYTRAKTALGRLYLLAGRLRRRFPPREPMGGAGEP